MTTTNHIDFDIAKDGDLFYQALYRPSSIISCKLLCKPSHIILHEI